MVTWTMNRIPPVRTWKVRVVETGEVLYFDTINKRMVRIIVGMDYPRLWGKTLAISLVKYNGYERSEDVDDIEKGQAFSNG